MRNAAEVIKNLGPRYVLIKGGHLKERAVDLLYDGNSFETLDAPRVAGKEFRGTGCAMSAAIAAGLARGFDMKESVNRSKKFVTRALNTGYENLGKGMGILNHNLPLQKEL
jgi:hydroxymethylpyrimidine/phosphomethylpyrimidine kinase